MNRESLRSTIIALGCFSILTLVLSAGESVGISPIPVTVDTRWWFDPEVSITMHRVKGDALENGGIGTGIDEELQVKGNNREVLDRQPQLPLVSTWSPPVSGLVADGVTPLLFRVSAGGGLSGQVTYDVKLRVIETTTSCKNLSSARLMVLENGAFRAGSKVTLSSQQPEAYLVLRPVAAAEVISNPATTPGNHSNGTAEVELSLKREGASWWTSNADEIRFGVRKPPVVLVHGYNSDSSAWAFSFKSSLLADRGDSFVVAVNYGTANDNHENTYGDLVTLTETLRKALAIQMESRDGTALWPADKWAWTRYDAVGHSQGGVLLRLLCSSSSSTSCIAYPFRNSDNYFRGRFQRLVTVGSPHFGSTMAQLGIGLRKDGLKFGSWQFAAWDFLGPLPLVPEPDEVMSNLLQPKFRIDSGDRANTPQALNQAYIPDPASRLHMLAATVDHGQVPGPSSLSDLASAH